MSLIGIIASSRPATLEPVAGYKVWLDASDTSTITESSNAVSAWTDKSANAYVFQQTSATSKPTTNTRTINSLNVIDFDGTNDHLISTAASSTWSFLHNSTGGTIFYVLQIDTVPPGDAGAIISTFDVDASRVGIYQDFETNKTARVWIGGGSGTFVVSNKASSNATVGVTYSFGLLSDPSNGTTDNRAKLYRNNNTNIAINQGTGGGTVSSASPADNLRIGSGPGFNFINGIFGEIIMYDSQLSSGDIDTNMTYLKTKWGI